MASFFSNAKMAERKQGVDKAPAVPQYKNRDKRMFIKCELNDPGTIKGLNIDCQPSDRKSRIF